MDANNNQLESNISVRKSSRSRYVPKKWAEYDVDPVILNNNPNTYQNSRNKRASKSSTPKKGLNFLLSDASRKKMKITEDLCNSPPAISCPDQGGSNDQVSVARSLCSFDTLLGNDLPTEDKEYENMEKETTEIVGKTGEEVVIREAVKTIEESQDSVENTKSTEENSMSTGETGNIIEGEELQAPIKGIEVNFMEQYAGSDDEGVVEKVLEMMGGDSRKDGDAQVAEADNEFVAVEDELNGRSVVFMSQLGRRPYSKRATEEEDLSGPMSLKSVQNIDETTDSMEFGLDFLSNDEEFVELGLGEIDDLLPVGPSDYVQGHSEETNTGYLENDNNSDENEGEFPSADRGSDHNSHNCEPCTAPLYKCSLGRCSRTFKQQLSFLNHLKSHSKSFKCLRPDCEKSYKSKQGLQRHDEDFYGEHQCKFCSFTCWNKAEFTSHQKIHTPVKTSYMCPVCGKTGSIKNLSHHMKVHNPAIPKNRERVNCEVCSKSMFKDGYRRHLEKCQKVAAEIRHV